MKKKPAPKTRNPQDATRRNVRAANDRMTRIEGALSSAIYDLELLSARVRELEQRPLADATGQP